MPCEQKFSLRFLSEITFEKRFTSSASDYDYETCHCGGPNRVAIAFCIHIVMKGVSLNDFPRINWGKPGWLRRGDYPRILGTMGDQ